MFGPSYVIQIYFQLAAVVAFAGTIPVASWHIGLFVKPALRPHERKAVLAYHPIFLYPFR
ncbi:twin-arginine translocase subunit TatC [Bacillus sp. EB600]|uniref:twin-arginine translocase subunit TatC n=1 Tax=Bacillus sp. EB600 TaxID=2806345 RepID=UPI0021099FD5|nr:twin-arginine translocase subunit TatC [Bacillus sp. EB600]MCQ6280417.1 twin-arginine translocase subunit TatC [Bacillus sp. EB600]